MRKSLLRIVSLACCVGMLLATSAMAAEEQPPVAPPAAAGEGTIEVLRMVDDTAVKGADIFIYRVGDLTKGVPSWTEEYAGYQLTLNPKDQTSYGVLPQNLVTVINRDKKEPVATAKTGEDGKASFTGLVDGLYLVNGSRYRYNGYYYDPIPVLVFVPYLNEDSMEDRNVPLELKHTATRVPSSGGGDSTPQRVSRKVLKVWDDVSNEEDRPDSVTVQLLNGDRVVDAQVLSEKNNWRFTWTNLDKKGDWSVAEVDVPEQYSVSVREEGVTFVVTNTFEEDVTDNPTPETQNPEESQPPVTESQPPVEETTPPEETPGPVESQEPDEDIDDNDTPKIPGLPQTGQLWMPVIFCSGTGIVCIMTGLIMKKKENTDEA